VCVCVCVSVGYAYVIKCHLHQSIATLTVFYSFSIFYELTFLCHFSRFHFFFEMVSLFQ